MVGSYNTRTSSNKPYSYKGHLRCFASNLTKEDLKWHRDRGTRFVKIVSGEDWYLQFDDSTPILLHKNKIYKIPSAKYHRLLNLGLSELRITILEP